MAAFSARGTTFAHVLRVRFRGAFSEAFGKQALFVFVDITQRNVSADAHGQIAAGVARSGSAAAGFVRRAGGAFDLLKRKLTWLRRLAFHIANKVTAQWILREERKEFH